MIDDRDQVIRRILRVNHSGEHGAVAIYSAQLAWTPADNQSLVQWLEETLAHETRHRDTFRSAMPSRHAKPCRAMAVWSIGGALLGWLTALSGETGIMVCTAAVERTVHKHLNEQISYLSGRDGELAEIIRGIRAEEDEHLAYAEAHHNPETFFAWFLSFMVASATDMLIWISTRGDSLKLKAALRNASSGV